MTSILKKIDGDKVGEIWTVKRDLSDIFKEFHRQGKLHKDLNSTPIVIISQGENPVDIRDVGH